MKKTLAILAVLLAAKAYAETAWVNVGLRKVNKFQHPQTVTVEGRTVSLPPTITDSALAYLAAAGWVAYDYDCAAADTILDYDVVPPFRCMTQAEIDARAAQQAAEQAAAEAAATQPAQFPTGIATTNAAGHWVEFVPDGTNVVAQTLAIQVSHSPLTPEQRAEMKAAALADREAKKAAARRAKARGNLQERIAALEALADIK